MINQYSLLLSSNPPSINEKIHPYSCLTERHLQAMWLEQKYFKNLLSINNEPITVISPGIWNGEAGPDFLKAHLKIGNLELKGDVEIHLQDESWYHHQHHTDERYDSVVLHVGFWKSRNGKQIFTKSGQSVAQTCLEDFLTIPLERIIQLIDLDLYPYKNFLGSGKCAHDLFRSLPEKKILSFFNSASTWRLTKKRRLLKFQNDDPSLAFVVGLAMSLGFRYNADAFAVLLKRLLKYPSSDEDCLTAFCLGTCGYFEGSYLQKWSTSEKFMYFYSLFQKIDKSELEPIKLILHQKRPLNNPIRRLTALAKMACDKNLFDLYSSMADLWKNSYFKYSFSDLRKQFHDMLPSYKDAYWNDYYTFEQKPQKKFLPLIGEDLKNTMLINVFLPFLQEDIETRNSPKEIDFFENFYQSFPASKTGKAKYLVHRFFGESAKSSLINRAYLEQGLYQLHKDFCIHYEASCVGCPFVKNYLSTCAS